MHALRLITRFKRDDIEHEACLLVYDTIALNGTILSDDIRDHFNQRPITKSVFILAPFISETELREAMFEGSLFDRVKTIFKNHAGEISLLTFSVDAGGKQAAVISFSVDSEEKVIEAPPSELSIELRNGWLFALFDSNKGLVNAPVGVHFGKGSKKHSAKFLRTSAVLLTSEACAAVAYFSLSTAPIFQPKRIFVDTAPLISVAFALQRIAKVHNLWMLDVPVSSFSSYGGVDRLPRPSRRDLVLISASTSGGLINHLVDIGFSKDAVILLFFLGLSDRPKPDLAIVCDLTYRSGVLFGYASIENYPSNNCPLCKKGYFLAALEGDQFMLESRAVKELSVLKKTQAVDAREIVEEISRHCLLRIPVYATAAQRFNINFDFSAALNASLVRARVVKLIRRYMPTPLDYVILVDIDEREFRSLLNHAQLEQFFDGVRIVHYSSVRTLPPVENAGVLVFVACLKEYSVVRDINAELRSIANNGCIAYLSAMTLAESPEQLAGLRNFLTFGASGRDSFSFVSAYNLLLPFTHDERSAWDLELELFRKISDEGYECKEFAERLAVLNSSSEFSGQLFWSATNSQLAINSDFVYLDTSFNRDQISQADVYVVVENLIAAARIGERPITSAPQANPLRWQQSVYGQTLLSVSNFENYNDAVLRAAFVRAASSAELNYSTHQSSSSRMLEILQQGLQGWQHSMGGFMPELLMAMATHRLKLTDADTVNFKSSLRSSSLPNFLKKLGNYI
jgi:hypothetical protein